MLDLHFKPVSNVATWQQAVEVTDEATDTPLDLVGYDINVSVVYQSFMGPGSARPQRWGGMPPGGINYQGYQTPVLQASTGNGRVAVVGPGVFVWTFTPLDMTNLNPGSYEIGATMRDPKTGFTTQLFVGLVPIIAGIVAQAQ